MDGVGEDWKIRKGEEEGNAVVEQHTAVVGLVGILLSFFELGGELFGLFFFGLVALVGSAFGAEGVFGHGGWTFWWL